MRRMRDMRWVVAVVAAIGCVGAAQQVSQRPPAAAAERKITITPTEVVRRYVRAIGGEEKLSKLKTAHLHVESDVPPFSRRLIIDRYEMADGRVYQSEDMNDGWQFRSGFDGTKWWRVVLHSGALSKYEPERSTLNHASLLPISVGHLLANESKLRVMGGAKLAGGTAIVVSEEGDRGMRRLFYFDATSGLLLRTVEPFEYVNTGAFGKALRASNDGRYGGVSTCDVSEYQAYEGVLIASSVKCNNGMMELTYKTKSIEFNVPVQEAMFEEPKAVRCGEVRRCCGEKSVRPRATGQHAGGGAAAEALRESLAMQA